MNEHEKNEQIKYAGVSVQYEEQLTQTENIKYMVAQTNPGWFQFGFWKQISRRTKRCNHNHGTGNRSSILRLKWCVRIYENQNYIFKTETLDPHMASVCDLLSWLSERQSVGEHKILSLCVPTSLMCFDVKINLSQFITFQR